MKTSSDQLKGITSYLFTLLLYVSKDEKKEPSGSGSMGANDDDDDDDDEDTEAMDMEAFEESGMLDEEDTVSKLISWQELNLSSFNFLHCFAVFSSFLNLYQTKHFGLDQIGPNSMLL